jgi:hypothetical protein
VAIVRIVLVFSVMRVKSDVLGDLGGEFYLVYHGYGREVYDLMQWLLFGFEGWTRNTIDSLLEGMK